MTDLGDPRRAGNRGWIASCTASGLVTLGGEVTFSNPRQNLYVCSAGFRVEFVDLFDIHYREQGRVMIFAREPLLSGGWVLYIPQQAGWEPPHDRKSVDEHEVARVVDNIRRAFAFAGLSLEVS
jgi:hypothetical protein